MRANLTGPSRVSDVEDLHPLKSAAVLRGRRFGVENGEELRGTMVVWHVGLRDQAKSEMKEPGGLGSGIELHEHPACRLKPR
jgi:hypothetical protein